MKSLVYYSINNVDRNRLINGDAAFIKCLAFSKDGHTVLHAFANESLGANSGYPIDCFFVLSKRMQLNANGEPTLDNSFFPTDQIKGGHPSLIIAMSDAGDIEADKAFFFNLGTWIDCEVNAMPTQLELYSRAKGLVEVDVLRDKSVSIIGLGSGGSSIALELAKSGVGKFVLIDFDRIEFSNVSRHICGTNDLGRYKTRAVKDYILQKNPYCDIITSEIDINESLETLDGLTGNTDLIVCATDTNKCRLNVNQISLRHRIPSLFGRALTRAAGGDVLRVRPFEGPCLNCIFSSGFLNKEEEISQMRQVRSEMPSYVSDSEAAKMIQVGLSADIVPIANMVVKLALVELSRGHPTALNSLEEDLVADFYLWANRRELVYANWPKMEYSFNKQSILRWYGAKIKRDENCVVCGAKPALEDDFFK